MENNVTTKKAEWIALWALLLHLLFSALAFLLYSWSRLETSYFLGYFFLFGIPLWGICLLHMRQRRLAQEEELTEKQYAPQDQNTLFEGYEVDPFSARNQLKNFEKWVVPIATLVLAIVILITASVTLYQYSEYFSVYNNFLNDETQKVIDAEGQASTVNRTPIMAAFLVGFAFFAFLISKFAIGMSQQKNWRLLRAGGSYLFITSVFSFLAAVSTILISLKIFVIERYLALIIPSAMSLIALEMLLNLLLDIYRPRIAEQEVRFAYDSRFLEVFTGSKGIFSTAAHTLDYQFGFKISETWFYHFLERAIAPLILFQILALYAFNCIVIVEPSEQAIIERFGNPVRDQVFEPGIHFKWPWPIETAYRYPINKVHELHIGAALAEEGAKLDEEAPLIFSKVHVHDEGYFIVSHHVEEQKSRYLFDLETTEELTPPQLQAMLTERLTKENIQTLENSSLEAVSEGIWRLDDRQQNQYQYFIEKHGSIYKVSQREKQIVPVNLLLIHVLLRYRVKDIFDYVYNQSQPEELITSISYREATRYFASLNMNKVLSGKRTEISEMLQNRIQKKCDASRLGIEISFVGILEVHPPVPVIKSFEIVIAANEHKKAQIEMGETYKEQTEKSVKGEKAKILNEADTYLYEKTRLTEAEANMFRDILTAYRKGGKVFLTRKYLTALEKFIEQRRLYVTNLPNVNEQTNVINLEDSMSDGIMSLDLSSQREEK